MQTMDLNGSWDVKDAPLTREGEKGRRAVARQRAGWIKARVPGEIHLDLVRAGRMPEPLVSTHARDACRWPEERSWWYRTSFRVTNAFLTHECQELIFDGLDLNAQIFLNGRLIGEAANAFVPARFDVRHRLVSGRNELMVRLTVGSELASDSEGPSFCHDIYANRNFPERRWLRKPQFTYGWDWVDALPNIGIWRGVRLEGRSQTVLHDLRLDTRRHGKRVFLDMAAVLENLHPWSERACALHVTIKPPRGKAITYRKTFALLPGRTPITAWIEIPDPQWWWPNGMGAQPLYHVTARIRAAGAICDRREFDIGLRTVEIDRTPLKAGGSRFCIRVNGQDVFCKGANWIPGDAIIARMDGADYEHLVDDARKANINMLRIWGGGIYEDPAFYEACDRAGVLIWQDFMFACSLYPDHDAAFQAAVRAEAEAVVTLLRHHPCIALWSGNNENTWGFCDWWNKDKNGFEPDIAVGGAVVYNQILPDVCRLLDPARPYWPSSPAGGPRPNSEADGDCHWWQPCTMNQDVNRRIRHEVFDECRARFVSEYGVIGPCHLDSIKQYLKPDERTPDTLAWRIHTNTFEKETLPAAIRRHYAEPEGLSVRDYILYGQMFQAEMYGHSIEALRFRKHDARDDCQGALIWMYTDCWGETGWTLIDYHRRRKASYYAFKRACTPLKAIVRRRGRELVVRVVNDTLEQYAVHLNCGWMHVSGTETKMKTKPFRMGANAMREVARESIPARSVMDPREWIYVAYLSGDNDIEPAPSIWLLTPHRELRQTKPDLAVSVKGHAITVTSPVYCHGVHVDDKGREVLSDNYFDLLPGVPHTVQRMDGGDPRKLRFRTVRAACS